MFKAQEADRFQSKVGTAPSNLCDGCDEHGLVAIGRSRTAKRGGWDLSSRYAECLIPSRRSWVEICPMKDARTPRFCLLLGRVSTDG